MSVKALVGILGFGVGVVLLAAGCSGRHTLEDFPKSPWYFDGQHSATPRLAEAGGKPERPEPGALSSAHESGETPPNTVVLSALIDRGDESAEKSFIAGRFLCRQVREQPFEFPCNNVRVAVQDQRGHVVHRLQTVDGEFVFPVERQKQYFLRVLSKHQRDAASPLPPLVWGEDVVLHLIER